MTVPGTTINLAAIRRRPDVARIIRAWRELTTVPSARRIGPGERTLVAVSGGADSSALLLALASAPGAGKRLVVGHVVHDLRPRVEAEADRDAVRSLAAALKLGFASSAVEVRPDEPGNAEGRARRLRYETLARMASDAGCRFIATGHHAEDQLETVLIALLRGAGPRGMAGVAVQRRERVAGTGKGVWVIRPLLGDRLGKVPATMRAEAEAICTGAGWTWRTDQTNRDRSMLRNALRAEVVPVLERLRPGAALRATRGAVVSRDSARVIGRRARELFNAAAEEAERRTFMRDELRREPSVIAGELLRISAKRLAGGRGADRLSRSGLAPVLAAIADGATEPRRFVVGSLAIRVTSRQVTVEAIGTDAADQ